MNKQKIVSIVIAVLSIGIITTGIYLYQSDIIFPTATESEQEIVKDVIEVENKTLSYAGKDGISALALLEQTAKTEISGTGEMAFVTSINGLSADSTKNEYWAFEINGKPSEVGAGSYITNNNDTITWKLSSF